MTFDKPVSCLLLGLCMISTLLGVAQNTSSASSARAPFDAAQNPLELRVLLQGIPGRWPASALEQQHVYA